MKKIFLFTIALVVAASFISCEKNSSSQQDPEPTPQKLSAGIRFYVTQDMVDLTDLSFMGQFNGGTEFSSINPTQVQYVEKYDGDIKLTAEAADITSPLVVYQYDVTLDKGSHKFKVLSNRNSASTTKEEVDLIVGIRYVSNSLPSADQKCGCYGGVKVDGLQNFLTNYINVDEYIFTLKY